MTEVDHPSHYNKSPSGIECIDVVEHLNFNRGNAIKYIWRAEDKGDPVTDLAKARWYIDREIERLSREQSAAVTLIAPSECVCRNWAVEDMRRAPEYGREHHPRCDGTGQHKTATT